MIQPQSSGESEVAITDRYRRAADLPRRLPLFPLRGVLLLPRIGLPLNIFEPRYLALLEDAIAGERMIGIIQPAASDAAEESPPGMSVDLRRVGCAGRITAFQELDDGRYAITLTGICRFEITHEVPTVKQYRLATAGYDRFEHDLEAGAGEAEVDRDTLLETLKRYTESRQLQADWSAIQRAPSESLVNTLSIISPYGPEEKQALLEASDLKTRAELLVALAEMELAAQGGSSGSTLQ